MTSPTKVAVHSLSDLKNTTDDALSNYLTSLSFTKSQRALDVRLALGYAAVLVAAVTFYLDWTLGWAATKRWTAWAVAAYFLLNGAFTWWIWRVEAGAVFEGADGAGQQLKLSARADKHAPTYRLTARYASAADGAAGRRRRDVAASFTRWFTADGYMVARPFQQWLASEIPPIGAADPGNVVEEIGRGSRADEGPRGGGVGLERVLGQLGAGGSQSGGAKRRKG